MKRSFLKSGVLLSVFAFLALFSAGTSYGKSIIKLAHIDPADPFQSADHAAAVVFKTMVEAGTNGEIEVRIYPASQLGNAKESMAMLKKGTLQMFISSAGGLATVYPLLGVLDTPFAIPNMTVAWDVFDGPFGDELKQSIQEKTGLRLLEILDQGGFFHFTNNKRPVTSIEDIKGIKFRTMTLPSHIAFFKSMDGSAIPIAWAELYTSLQTGVVDGQHNPFAPILGSKLYEVQKYLTLSGHMWSTHWLLANNDWYTSLSPEHKQVMRNASNVAKTAGRAITKIYESSENGFPAIQKAMEINSLSTATKDEFAKVTIPAMTEFIKESLGEEGVALQKDFLDAIKASREKLDF